MVKGRLTECGSTWAVLMEHLESSDTKNRPICKLCAGRNREMSGFLKMVDIEVSLFCTANLLLEQRLQSKLGVVCLFVVVVLWGRPNSSRNQIKLCISVGLISSAEFHGVREFHFKCRLIG